MTRNTLDTRRALIGIALLVLYIGLYVVLLGARPLFIPDEVRYGEIAREMIGSGNWIVPRLDGLLYFEKPPLGHWLNALSLAVFGYNEFAVRFASVVAAGGSALIVFTVAGHFFRNRTTRLLAVFIFLTTLEVQAAATFSVLDTMFSTFLNAGIAVFALGAVATQSRQRVHNVCAGILFGIAFLTKGFLAFVLPGLILVPWLLYRRQYALLFRGSWLAVGAAVLVVLPWGIAIHQQQPDFWRYFIWVEHIQRFAGENAQHKEPFYYYLKFLPLATLPWFFLLPAASRGLLNQPSDDRRASGILLLVLWAIVPLIFFSASSGKLVTYILPCMVPFAVFMGAGLRARRRNSRLLRSGLALTCLVALSALTALLIAQFAGKGPPLYDAAEFGRFAALSAALLFGTTVLMAATLVHSDRFRSLASGIAIVPILLALPLCLPNKTLERKAPVDFLKRLSEALPSDAVVITNGSLVRAVSWSLQRDDIYVIEDPGETAYGLAAPDGAGRFLRPPVLSNLLRQSASRGRDVLIVCKGECAPETLNVLPDDAAVHSCGNFFSYRLRARGGNGNSDE